MLKKEDLKANLQFIVVKDKYSDSLAPKDKFLHALAMQDRNTGEISYEPGEIFLALNLSFRAARTLAHMHKCIIFANVIQLPEDDLFQKKMLTALNKIMEDHDCLGLTRIRQCYFLHIRLFGGGEIKLRHARCQSLNRGFICHPTCVIENDDGSKKWIETRRIFIDRALVAGINYSPNPRPDDEDDFCW